MNSYLKYSPPLSDMMILSFLPDWFSTKALKALKRSKNSDLCFSLVNPTILVKVIYEGQCIFGLTHGHMRKWTSNVTMDQLKRCRGSLMTSSLKFVLSLFSLGYNLDRLPWKT